ncbi:MAG: right-handed parallel beta-helix repeat-containing protein [Candidatus Bathyarchaeota archaeon]|nr:right-handed parallel beta-helix repeat-containing protein [Candidatus Bathyarchaeum sp.]
MNPKTAILVFLLTVLLAGTIALALKPAFATSEPSTITVPDDYPRIQDALAAANTGDTIIVKAGTYNEEWVSVNKQVSLVGDNQKSLVYYSGAVGFIVTVDNAQIRGFTIVSKEALQGYAISMSSVTGCIVEDNLIEDNLVGVSVTGSSSSNTISGNILNHNERSIELYNSPDNTISENNITGAIVSAISLDESSGNTVSGNWISELVDGMGALMLWSSSNNVISRNVLYGGNPMLLLSSSNNIFSDNFVVDSEYGIVVGLSSDNEIYTNYFINVMQLTMDTDISEGTPSTNSWDNGSKGNYWSDYVGTDGNGDGIGDTPHVLYENNQDNFPLMKYPSISTNPQTDSSLPTEVVIVIVVAVVALMVAVAILKLRKH